MMQKKLLGMKILFLVIVFFSGMTYSQSSQPSNLKAEVKGNVVQLSWVAPTTSEKVIYNVYKAETTSPEKQIDPAKLEFTKISTATESAYQDKEATSGKAYVYYVVSMNSKGKESSVSNYINVRVGDTYGKKDNDEYRNEN